MLAIAGDADAQAPITNLPDLKRSFRDNRAVVLAHTGHELYLGGCIDRITADFVDSGTTRHLDTRCARTIAAPRFTLAG